MKAPALEADRLTEAFGDHVAVDHVRFSVPNGSFLGLMIWLGVRDSTVPIQVAGNLVGMLVGVATSWWCDEHAIGKPEREVPSCTPSCATG